MKTKLEGAGMALIAVLHASPIKAQTISDDQRQQIETIVREYLLENPEILQQAYEVLQERSRQQEAESAKKTIAENRDAILRSASDFVAGNPNGKVTVVEFFDYNCQYCKRAAPQILNLIEADPDVRVVMKEFPILSDGSNYAAKAALASMKQGKYWDLHRALMDSTEPIDDTNTLEIAKAAGIDTERLTKDMESADIEKTIKQNHELAQKLGYQRHSGVHSRGQGDTGCRDRRRVGTGSNRIA